MDKELKNLIAKAELGDIEAMVMVGDCYNVVFIQIKMILKSKLIK